MTASLRTVRAPGRVNLIGDHTDYTGGLVLPMAINLETRLTYEADPKLNAPEIDSAVENSNTARYINAVFAELQDAGMNPSVIRGNLTTTLPIGAGLSSSAALEVAVALACGAPCTTEAERVHLARIMQRAEQRAVGVPCGIMDQLICLVGRANHAMLIDCDSLDVAPVLLPPEIDVVVQFIAERTLAGSAYSDRVAQCATAEQIIGPLRDADVESVRTISDDVIRRRARHVISENSRVRDFATALTSGDISLAGELMYDSHRSLSTDFEVSTSQMDTTIDDLRRTSGVIGARMTGGGFGGCVVALVERGVDVPGWRVSAADGASIAE